MFIFFTSPVKSFTATNDIRPNAMPYEMLYVNGIMTIVINDGRATAGLSHSILVTQLIIDMPT